MSKYNELIEKWAEEMVDGAEIADNEILEDEEMTPAEAANILGEEYEEVSDAMDQALNAIKEAEEYFDAADEVSKEAAEQYETYQNYLEDAEKRACACEEVCDTIDEEGLDVEADEISAYLEKTASVYNSASEDMDTSLAMMKEASDNYDSAEAVKEAAIQQYNEAMEVLEAAEKYACELEFAAEELYDSVSEE